jgi:hypothetical protein
VDGRDCLLAVEPGARGEFLVKPGRAHRLPDLGHRLGFPLLLQWPHPQADTLAQALDRPLQPRGPVPVTLDERQLGEGGQAQGHAAGAVGRQTQLQPLVQQRPGLLGPALHEGQGAQLHLGPRAEPSVIEPIRQGPRLAQVAEGVLVASQGRLPEADGEGGYGRPVRLVLAAELLQARQLCPQGAVEVAEDPCDPRHDREGHRVQVGVADLGQQRFETLAGCGQRRLVLAHHLYGSHCRRPQQLGLGVGFHRVGGGQLVDPAASLTQVVPQPPE